MSCSRFYRIIALVIFQGLFLLGVTGAALAETFEEAYLTRRALGNPPASESALRGAALKDKQLVFITGVLSEITPLYFYDVRDVLRHEYGIYDSVIVRPKSFLSITDNSEILYKKFLEIQSTAGKPLIILAHSKGAAETVLALLHHPDLIKNGIIEKVYALQGALNGSYIADLINGKGKWKFWAQLLAVRMPGLVNLGTENARAVMGEAIAAAAPEDKEALRERLFYIRSVEAPWQTVFYMIGTNRYLTRKYGENDGVLLEEDQLLPGLGTDLGVMHHIDHSDFVMCFPYSGAFRSTRSAFVHTWVQYILGQ